MKIRLPAVLLMLAVSAQAAVAGVIDFEGEAYGNVAGETLVYERDGITVTITGTGLQIRTLGGDFDDTYCQTRYLSTTGDSQEITVTFSEGVDDVTILNPINGTITGEIDLIDGEAYDDVDVLLDSFSGSDVFGFLAGPEITRTTYDDADSTGYVIGALSFNESLESAICRVAPVPTTNPLGVTILVLISLLIGVQVIRRRQVHVS